MKRTRMQPGWKGLTTVLVPIMLLFLSIGEAKATTLLKVSMEELTSSADRIVYGTAQESWSQWDANTGKIFTYTRFLVNETVKGDALTREVIVKTPGGELDGVKMEVPSAPEINIGGEYILFLYSDTDSYQSNVVGWRQGQFTVQYGVVQENNKSVEEFTKEIKSILERTNR